MARVTGHPGGVGVGLADRGRDFLVAVLQLDARDDGLRDRAA
jgi:hypothetical protein